ncbi:MAG: M23 family metallopeptidase [Myxococcota bacterium]
MDAREDAEVPTDASTDSELVRQQRIALRGGAVIRGEVFATYDHRIFWDPEDRTSIGVFREDQFAGFPNDRSVTVLDEATIVSREDDGVVRRSFARFRRSEGIVMRQLPLRGVNYIITAGESYHLEENGYGHFAWDIVRNRDGARFANRGESNEDYFVWDEPVYLPTGGVVVEVESRTPDNTPGTYEDGTPDNLVGVHLGGSYYLYVLHLRQGSIPSDVIVGARLRQGHLIGHVGNSGISLEPHVHIAMLAVDADHLPPRSWGVPLELRRGYVARRETGGVRSDYIAPSGGTWISDAPF